MQRSLDELGFRHKNEPFRDFPVGPVVKTSPSNAGGAGLIPGLGAEIPHALQPKYQNIKQKQYCNKFNKDLKKRANFFLKKTAKKHFMR